MSIANGIRALGGAATAALLFLAGVEPNPVADHICLAFAGISFFIFYIGNIWAR